jgi:hypothetical protein
VTALQYALLNASHILFLGMFVGATIAMDLGHLQVPAFAWTIMVAGPLRRTAIHALVCAAGTGVLLMLVRPSDYLQNAPFLVKMGIVFLAVGNAFVFQRVSSSNVRKAQAGLALWLCVMFAGVRDYPMTLDKVLGAL